MTNTMARIFPNWEDVSMRVVDYEALPWAPTYLKDFCVIPASVNSVSEAFKIPSYLNPDAAKLHMLSEVLSNGTMHKLIREKGGAYGAFAGCDPLNGVMTLSSYRDPKNLETYENFERAILTINEGKFK
jgi:Zn-dependent M16 (insulinase) family peptidase